VTGRARATSFAELTDAGKLRRLRALALEALSHYDLARPTLTFHAFATNVLYRVTTATGERFVLRLAVPGWRTLEDHLAEAAWLDALARDTAIRAPRIVPARSGAQVLPLAAPGVPGTWDAMLMTWLPGRLLGHHLHARNLAKLGALFAELHDHGARWTPPAGFTRRRFEHWLSRGEESRITSGAGAAPASRAASGVSTAQAAPAAVANLPAAWRASLDDMDRRVEAAYAAVDRRDLRVIHCDLWHDNVKLHRGELLPFDFEDTVWGFRAHDIAMAMLDLLEVTDEARYAVLLTAFRRGYEAHLAWPEDPIEPFQLGRLLWILNWVAREQPQWLAGAVERHVAAFEHYGRTGRVVWPGRA
jgi:Ser/Thr protein kinase RdoA (MazF antagonist)